MLVPADVVVETVVEVDVEVDVDVLVSDFLSEPQPTSARLSATVMVAAVKYFINDSPGRGPAPALAGSD